MKTPICKWVMASAVVACTLTGAAATQSVRIAFIDPLSGPFANIGEMEVRAFQYAIAQARSIDPEKVAHALEGMNYDWLYGDVQMRADNHQLIQPLFISSVAKVDGKKLRFDADRTGMGWQVERRIEGKDTVMPTRCKMERPQ